VELIEEGRLAGGRVRGEGVAGENDQGIVDPIAFGAWCGRQKLVPLGDAMEILVGDGDGMVEGIKQDGVGGLRTYARQSQQTPPKRGRWSSGELFERAGKLGVQHGDKCFERGGFAGVKAGGTNEILQIFEGERAQATEIQRRASAKIGQGALDGFPGGVLG
jgi:hypothetical protein